MTRELFLRFVWKEYRQMRGFWLALVAFGIFAQWFALWIAEPETSTPLYAIAYVAVLLYALGCSATLFALEDEDDTIGFLRAQPLRPWPVYWTKSIFCTASMGALAAALVCTAAILARHLGPMAQPIGGIKTASIVLGVTALVAFGTYVSMLLRRPMIAALVTGTAAGLGNWVYSALLDDARLHGSSGGWLLHGGDATFVGLTVAALMLLALGLARQVPRWFFGTRSEAGGEVETALDVTSTQVPLVRQARMFKALFWQWWGQSRGLALALLGSCVLLAVLAATSGDVEHFAPLVLTAIAIVVPLFGSCAFLGDQQRSSFRFLAEQGISARTVWFSRHVAWLATLVAFLLLLIVANAVLALFLGSDYDYSKDLVDEIRAGRGRALDMLYLAVVFGGLAYSSGQLASMTVRSGILAATLGVVLSIAVLGWAIGVMVLHVPWRWAVLPIPAVFMWATWLHAPNWVRDGGGRRGWARLAASVLVPVGTILVAFCLYRVFEVPATDPGFSPSDFQRTLDFNTSEDVARYDKAALAKVRMAGLGSLELSRSPYIDEELRWEPLPARESAWVEANSRAVAVAMGELNVDDEISVPQGAEGVGYHALLPLLVVSARFEETRGDLDAAWQRYRTALEMVRSWVIVVGPGGTMYEAAIEGRILLWAALPGQTPERVREARSWFVTWCSEMPTVAHTHQLEYLRLARFLDRDPEVWSEEFTPTERFWLQGVSYAGFWEIARSRRVLDQLSRSDLQALAELEATLRAGESVAPALNATFQDFPNLRRDPQLTLWSQDTFWLRGYRRLSDREDVMPWIEHVARRRAVETILALESWRLAHGELPPDLQALVGSELDRLPHDPWTGQPFAYAPKGLPFAFDQITQRYTGYPGERMSEQVLPANTPFLAEGVDQVLVTGYEAPPEGDDQYLNTLKGRTIFVIPEPIPPQD